MSRRTRSGWPLRVEVDGTGEPVCFRWRGRRYQVRAVHAHWVEAGAWWSERSLRPSQSLGSSAGWMSARRDIWRVEASASTGQVGAYDLQLSADEWRLLQVMD